MQFVQNMFTACTVSWVAVLYIIKRSIIRSMMHNYPDIMTTRYTWETYPPHRSERTKTEWENEAVRCVSTVHGMKVQWFTVIEVSNRKGLFRRGMQRHCLGSAHLGPDSHWPEDEDRPWTKKTTTSFVRLWLWCSLIATNAVKLNTYS